MTKSIQGTIQDVHIKKQGEKNGRPWTMYTVVINGEQLTTFDSKYKANIGKQGTWEYEEKQDGQYLNRTLSRYPEVKGNDGLLDDKVVRALGLIRGDIVGLKKELQEIKDMINAISVEVPDEQPANIPAGMVEDKDIPIIEENS